MFGPAQRAVAMAVADCVADGTIPEAEADDLFICVGVFIHWKAEDDKKIQDYNYEATKEAIKRAVAGEPKAAEVVAKRTTPSTRSRRIDPSARLVCKIGEPSSVPPCSRQDASPESGWQIRRELRRRGKNRR